MVCQLCLKCGIPGLSHNDPFSWGWELCFGLSHNDPLSWGWELCFALLEAISVVFLSV